MDAPWCVSNQAIRPLNYKYVVEVITETSSKYKEKMKTKTAQQEYRPIWTYRLDLRKKNYIIIKYLHFLTLN